MNPVEKVFEKIGKAIAWPFVHATEVIEVLTTALKDEPEVKTAIVGLVQQIQALVKDGSIAIAADGLNVPDDVATVAAAQTLFAYVTGTFLPTLESAYKDEKSDVETAASSDVEAAASSVIQTGPGLHAVSAA